MEPNKEIVELEKAYEFNAGAEKVADINKKEIIVTVTNPDPTVIHRSTITIEDLLAEKAALQSQIDDIDAKIADIKTTLSI